MNSNPDMDLLQQYLREMRSKMDADGESLNAEFSAANQKKSNTLNSIAADATDILMGPNRAMSALKLMYGLGKLAYEAYSVRQVVAKMDDYGEQLGSFSRFSGKFPTANPS